MRILDGTSHLLVKNHFWNGWGLVGGFDSYHQSMDTVLYGPVAGMEFGISARDDIDKAFGGTRFFFPSVAILVLTLVIV